MSIQATAENIENLIHSARELRHRLWEDPHRPRYHLMPPEGFFNDANGTIFWKCQESSMKHLRCDTMFSFR